MKTIIKIAVSGCCQRGEFVDECVSNSFDNRFQVNIVAGFDPNKDNLVKFAERLSIKFDQRANCYDDYEEMLDNEKLDAVFITSPDYFHYEQAKLALEKNIHVFLEKPLAISEEECHNLVQIAHKSTAKIMVGHNLRYMPFIQKMHQIVRDGTIGKVVNIWVRHFISYGGDAFFKDWHAEREKCGSLLLHKGCHDIDAIHFLGNSYSNVVCAFGQQSLFNELPKAKYQKQFFKAEDKQQRVNNWPPEEQQGFNSKLDVEDNCMMMMQLDNGIQCSYMQNNFTPDCSRNYTIIGTKGRIENFGNSAVHVYLNRTDNYSINGDEIFEFNEQEQSHNFTNNLIIRDFFDYIIYDKQPLVNLNDAFYSAISCIKGTQSMRNNGKRCEISAFRP
ncbi:Gfo/Idh/MocA family oxidoreductase [Lentisphaerota bacterium WC36G]|nr:Gfo/Idh/MocA family oxidoreductase [Lentisphaerae bacterium WC36]